MNRFFQGRFQIKNQNYLYLYSVIVGIFSGIAAALFSYFLHLAEQKVRSVHRTGGSLSSDLISKLGLIEVNGLDTILIVFIPALGGLLAGFIVHHFSKEAAGTGTDAMINAFHYKEGQISAKVPFYKSVATIITLGSGGSGGKEGPIAQVGAGIGVFVANLLRAGARARRTLLLAGTAAGLGAVFKSPLGGALTATEMVYKEDIESDALIPCFISSVTAYLIYTWYAGRGAFMEIGKVSFLQMNEIIYYLGLGVLCFLFGYLFLKGFQDTRGFISRLKIHPILKPAIGGFFVGCLSLLFFEFLSPGNNFFQIIFMGEKPLYLGSDWWLIVLSFLLIAFIKIVATTLTIGSGGSAGIFGPSLFIGGMLGAATGTFAQHMLPEQEVQIASFIVVGMGAFYAGVANAPIAGIIMVCEMTGSYILLPALIIVSIFTFILTRRISLYRHQVDNRFKSPAHYYNMKFDVIQSIKISDKFDELRTLAVVKKDITFQELQKVSADIQASDFVVVDKDDIYVGMLSLRNINMAEKRFNNPALKISSFIDNSVPAVEFDSTLSQALNIILQYDMDKAPVTSENKIKGYVRSKDIFMVYTDLMKSKLN